MNEQIEQIKNQVRDLIREISSMGEEPPEFIMDLLMQVIERAQGQIDQLRQQEQSAPEESIPTPPAQPPSDRMRMERPFPSSNIHSFAYDPESQRLYVRFQGTYPRQDGPVYSYDGVPQDIFNIFQKGAVPARTNGRNKWGSWFRGKSPSLGASMNALIKMGNYPYQRVA